MFDRVCYVTGIIYFAIATYGGAYFVGPIMMLALLFYLSGTRNKYSKE